MTHLTVVPPVAAGECEHTEHRGLTWACTLRPNHEGAHVLRTVS